MNTGVYQPSENAYPGVFITGQDALLWAEWLKATPEQRQEWAMLGHDLSKEMIDALESCRV